MSNPHISIWSHADGEDNGWWGVITHPAHLDSAGNLIVDTKWTIQVHNCKSYIEVYNKLKRFI